MGSRNTFVSVLYNLPTTRYGGKVWFITKCRHRNRHRIQVVLVWSLNLAAHYWSPTVQLLRSLKYRRLMYAAHRLGRCRYAHVQTHYLNPERALEHSRISLKMGNAYTRFQDHVNFIVRWQIWKKFLKWKHWHNLHYSIANSNAIL